MVRFVVMAAGQAIRMGQDKLVMPWLDSTVLGYVLHIVLNAIKKQGFSIELYVVARHDIENYLSGEDIAKFKEMRGIWLQIPNPKPLAETIRIGLADLNDSVQMIGFLPGDQVGVTAQGLAECLRCAYQLLPDFLVPMAGQVPGSPVFFHRRYVPELLDLRGEQGGKVILHRYPERWYKFEVNESLFQDVDTPAQYQYLLAQYKQYREEI